MAKFKLIFKKHKNYDFTVNNGFVFILQKGDDLFLSDFEAFCNLKLKQETKDKIMSKFEDFENQEKYNFFQINCEVYRNEKRNY